MGGGLGSQEKGRDTMSSRSYPGGEGAPNLQRTPWVRDPCLWPMARPWAGGLSRGGHLGAKKQMQTKALHGLDAGVTSKEDPLLWP